MWRGAGYTVGRREEWVVEGIEGARFSALFLFYAGREKGALIQSKLMHCGMSPDVKVRSLRSSPYEFFEVRGLASSE